MYWTAEIRSSSICLGSKRAGRASWPGASPRINATCSSIPTRRSSAGRISLVSVISTKSVADSSRGPGISLVVDVQLLLDQRRIANPLDPQHLLHLEAQRLPVLEDERDVLAHREPPLALVGDDGGPIVGTQGLVALGIDDLVQRQGPHAGPSP